MHDHLNAQPEHERLAPSAVAPSCTVVGPAPNSTLISNAVAGESNAKRKSKPFRKVLPT